MQTENTTAGQRLRWLREREGLSQSKLATLLSCSVRTVIDLEMGQTTPRLQTAVAIRKRYGIPEEAWVESRQSGDAA